MLPEDIKQLRETLGCTARELAETLKIEQKTVLAWEDGELFPTKRHVSMMERLAKQGPKGIVRKPRGKKRAKDMARLADPKLWEVVRKLIAYPDLFNRVVDIAADLPDPGDD